jgi:hypothetical protein
MEEQTKQKQTWWQKNKKLLIIFIAAVVIIVLLIVFVWAVYKFGWGWTGFAGGYSKITKKSTTEDTEYLASKTLWDWMQLLLVPIILAIGGFWLNQIQKNREERTTQRRADDEQRAVDRRAEIDRWISVDNQRQAALQTYIDRMSELLLKEHLGELTPDDKPKPEYSEVRKIARIRTLTVLPSLDPLRKQSVLQFLLEARLIDNDKCIILLGTADFSKLYLSKAILSGPNRSGANLRGADLNRAILTDAYLNGAKLNGAKLNGTTLSEAYLNGAILTDAYLNEANLSGAYNLTQRQLDQVYTCKGAILPKGLTCNRNP